MKLVIAVVSSDDANKVQKGLIKNKFFATRLQTQGSFLKAGNATFLIGVNDEKVDHVLEVIEEFSKKRITEVPNTIVNEFGAFSTLPTKVEVGGATIFVISVDQFLKI